MNQAVGVFVEQGWVEVRDEALVAEVRSGFGPDQLIELDARFGCGGREGEFPAAAEDGVGAASAQDRAEARNRVEGSAGREEWNPRRHLPQFRGAEPAHHLAGEPDDVIRAELDDVMAQSERRRGHRRVRFLVPALGDAVTATGSAPSATATAAT